MPDREIYALCNQIEVEVKCISSAMSAADNTAGSNSEIADGLKGMALSHLENIQRLVIMLTAEMTAGIPAPAEGEGAPAGDNGGGATE